MIDDEALKDGIVGSDLSKIIDGGHLKTDEDHAAVPPIIPFGLWCFVIFFESGEFSLFFITQKELEIVDHLVGLQLSVSTDFGIGHDETGDLVDGCCEDMREVKDRKTGKPGEVDENDRKDKLGEVPHDKVLFGRYDDVDGDYNEGHCEDHVHEIPREAPEIIEDPHKGKSRVIKIEDNCRIEELVEEHEDQPREPREEGQYKCKKAGERPFKIPDRVDCLGIRSFDP